MNEQVVEKSVTHDITEGPANGSAVRKSFRGVSEISGNAEANLAKEWKAPPELSAAEKKRIAEADYLANQKLAVRDAKQASIHFDGDKYWSQLPDGRWVPDKKEDVHANIMQEFGI